MKITIVALDTRGGVQPYTALALGLQDAGHDVQVACTSDFASGITARGLAALAINLDTEATVRGLGGAADLTRRERDKLMGDSMAMMVDATVDALLAGASDADLFAGGVGGSLVGKPVAESLGVPFLDAHLHPIGPPTRAFPGVLVRPPSWTGAPGRLLSHRLSAVALDLPFASGRRLARRRLQLPDAPPRRPTTLPSLYGYSAHVVPKPREWGPQHHVTGYWTLPAGPWQPSAALHDFVDAPDPFIAVGFGSMNSRDPSALGELVVDAARRAGVRVLLLSGWGGLAASSRDGVLVVDEAPHDWLFPRAAGVVHHGGAGTTGAGVLAGVPALVVPFAVDQPFWGARLAELGVGPAPIPRKRLTVANLAGALVSLRDDAAQRQRAADLGRRARSEGGVASAVEIIGRLAG